MHESRGRLRARSLGRGPGLSSADLQREPPLVCTEDPVDFEPGEGQTDGGELPAETPDAQGWLASSGSVTGMVSSSRPPASRCGRPATRAEPLVVTPRGPAPSPDYACATCRDVGAAGQFRLPGYASRRARTGTGFHQWTVTAVCPLTPVAGWTGSAVAAPTRNGLDALMNSPYHSRRVAHTKLQISENYSSRSFRQRERHAEARRKTLPA
jgi:hypothetical protein